MSRFTFLHGRDAGFSSCSFALRRVGWMDRHPDGEKILECCVEVVDLPLSFSWRLRLDWRTTARAATSLATRSVDDQSGDDTSCIEVSDSATTKREPDIRRLSDRHSASDPPQIAGNHGNGSTGCAGEALSLRGLNDAHPNQRARLDHSRPQSSARSPCQNTRTRKESSRSRNRHPDPNWPYAFPVAAKNADDPSLPTSACGVFQEMKLHSARSKSHLTPAASPCRFPTSA